MRGVDQSMRNEEAQVFETFVDFRGGAGKQQHHSGEKHQHCQHRGSQSGCCLDGLTGNQIPPCLAGQQQGAGQQQWQHYVDQAIEQQGGGQGRGAKLIGESGQQNRLEHPDAPGNMTQHSRSQGQQVHQQECAEGRCFGQ
ncbi:hypothetical protein D3C84_988350 [compost metagenome]